MAPGTDNARLSTLTEEHRRTLQDLLASPHVQDNAPARRCLEIELALSEVEFDGVPLAPSLTDEVGFHIYRGMRSPDRSPIRELLLGFLHRYRGVDRRAGGIGATVSKCGEVLFGLISLREYNREWVPRLVELFPSGGIHVISDDEYLRGTVAPAGHVSAWDEMPRVDLRRWRRMFDACSSRWRRAVESGRPQFGVSASLGFHVNRSLLVASQRVLRYGAFLERVRPSAVLVEYDRNNRGACLVLAARSRGIPTLTLVHGAINGPFGYTPVLADVILCWGELQREQLVEFGVPREKIRIVGFERLKAGPTGDASSVRRRLRIGNEDMVGLLATNPIEPGERLRLARAFCQGVSRTPGFQGVVRLHPSESLSNYDGLRGEYPGVLWTSNADLSLEEAFALSDVAVVHSSGFGTEALAKDRICVVLDVLQSPLGNGAVLFHEAGAPRVGSAEELQVVLSRIRSDDSFRDELKEKGTSFSRRMFAALGNDACRNIAGVVSEVAVIPDGGGCCLAGKEGAST